MRFDILDRKIPSLIGVLLIAIGIALTTFLIKGGTVFELLAGPSDEPLDVRITNISDSSFTVSYITDGPSAGTLNVGSNPAQLNLLVLDDRDQLSQTISSRKTHIISVRNLDEDSTYFFSINSGSKNYLNNGSSYSVKTGGLINDNPTGQIPISGKVLMPEGLAVSDGIVYVKIEGAQDLSGFLKNDGTYTIPLNNLRSSSFNSYANLLESTQINIEIISENKSANAQVTLDQINPVPTMSLSGTYEFSSPPQSAPETSNTTTQFSDLFQFFKD